MAFAPTTLTTLMPFWLDRAVTVADTLATFAPTFSQLAGQQLAAITAGAPPPSAPMLLRPTPGEAPPVVADDGKGSGSNASEKKKLHPAVIPGIIGGTAAGGYLAYKSAIEAGRNDALDFDFSEFSSSSSSSSSSCGSGHLTCPEAAPGRSSRCCLPVFGTGSVGYMCVNGPASGGTCFPSANGFIAACFRSVRCTR